MQQMLDHEASQRLQISTAKQRFLHGIAVYKSHDIFPPEDRPRLMHVSTNSEQSILGGRQVRLPNALRIKLPQDTTFSALQQASKRLDQLKLTAKQSTPHSGTEFIPDSEREAFASVFRDLLKAHAQVDKLVLLHLVYVKAEQDLSLTLRLVCLLLLWYFPYYLLIWN